MRLRRAGLLAVALVLAAFVLPAAASASAPLPLPLHFTVINASCPTGDAVECTISDTATIYVNAGADPFALQHGIGHLFDDQRLAPGDRIWFARMLGLAGRDWRSGTGVGGLRSPSERFADAYAACALHMDPRGSWETAYDYQPTPRRHRAVCNAIRRIGSR